MPDIYDTGKNCRELECGYCSHTENYIYNPEIHGEVHCIMCDEFIHVDESWTERFNCHE